MNKVSKIVLMGLLLMGTAPLALAQETASIKEPTRVEKKATAGKTEESTVTEPAPVPQASQECKICRWIEPTTATLSYRYRTVTDNYNAKTLDQGQHRIVLGAKFKFDREGRYSINAKASSGYYFNWAYADDGLGGDINSAVHKGAVGLTTELGKDTIPPLVESTLQQTLRAPQYRNATPEMIAALRANLTQIITTQFTNATLNTVKNYEDSKSKGWNLFLRQLYFEAKPVDGLSFQYGSLGIEKGVNTEATTFDDDGYVTGGRVSIKRPDKLWFDEASVTYAYLGDITTPNFFRRMDRMKQSNYHQFLLRKSFGKRVDVSTDYTFVNGTDTMHEGIKLNVKETKVLDSVLFEAYQRLTEFQIPGHLYQKGNGFAIQGEKKLFNRLTLGGGYADIDRDYTVYNPDRLFHLFGFAINGDQTGLSKRVIGKVNYQLTPDFSVSMFATKMIDGNPDTNRYIWNKSAFNVAVTYDLLKGLRKMGLFK
jgi:hypothetical protein